ncbi:hypothetical protein GUITHDRAFT_104207 [Guillardia theta CCMP2712]|uniref:Uncharacterized protein n=1 Tax=Guillardia theta (strain CCMP2712) TaxID=905079 RepID=L1JP42_GUITC|nr:hypothetical protein GUITHDRAFT_104207 [Guillardia theta CCMP2712]EKX49813.1 hypothetical protein GUITHDRAFT_104207 [Guillardia theta CCMP2712]|eukprot:XP_005836793.1 hypothetical protein GUITHDRAFT_104207 [Guillardia theta CCMP2712]
MLRHIPSGITVEFCFNSLGGFRYCNGNDAQPRYVSQDMEYLTVQDWRSDMAGEAIKIQHQTSTSPRQGVYLTPMGFLFIGTEGAMIVDERGDLGVSMEEAIGVVAMWNANRLLELNLH